MKAFEYDSGPMRFANLLLDLTILNLTALVCCIPLFTIGAAISAQYSSINSLMDGDRHVFQNFKAGFKQHFKQSTIIWVLFLLLTAAFYMDYHLLTTAIVPAKKLLLLISFFAFIALVFTILWSFAVLANYKGTIREVLFNAFVFSFMYAPISLIALGVYGLAFYLALRFTMARALFIVFGHAVILYINLSMFKMTFRRHTA